jgi:hypothetical protein
MHSWLKNDTTNAGKLLEQAAVLESSISYAYGPPTIVKPAPELYGEWLLQLDRRTEALAQFERTLGMQPNRFLAMEGKRKAMDQL